MKGRVRKPLSAHGLSSCYRLTKLWNLGWLYRDVFVNDAFMILQ